MAILRGWNNDGIEEPDDDWRYDDVRTVLCRHECARCHKPWEHEIAAKNYEDCIDETMRCEVCVEELQSCDADCPAINDPSAVHPPTCGYWRA